MYKIYDKSSNKIYDNHKDIVDGFMEYSHKRLKYPKPVTIYFVSDLQNANNPLGKTAYYDHGKSIIVLFTDNRHFKDILRSLSHELIHHAQACRGEFDGDVETGEGYAQKDPHMRKMEAEAYLKGNLNLRDYEDKKKSKVKIPVVKIARASLMKEEDALPLPGAVNPVAVDTNVLKTIASGPHGEIKEYNPNTMSPKTLAQFALDVIGFIEVPIGTTPVTIGMVADGINAIWYFSDGDIAGGIFSSIGAAIPVLGDAVKVARVFKNTPEPIVKKILDNSDNLIKFLEAALSKAGPKAKVGINAAIKRIKEIQKMNPEDALQAMKALLGSGTPVVQAAKRSKETRRLVRNAAKGSAKLSAFRIAALLKPDFSKPLFAFQAALYFVLISPLGSKVMDKLLEKVKFSKKEAENFVIYLKKLSVEKPEQALDFLNKYITEYGLEQYSSELTRQVRKRLINFNNAPEGLKVSYNKCPKESIRILTEEGSQADKLYPDGVCYNTRTGKIDSYFKRDFSKMLSEPEN